MQLGDVVLHRIEVQSRMFEDRHNGGRVGGSHTLEHVGLSGTVQFFSQLVPRAGTVGGFIVDGGLPTLQNGRSE